MYDRTWKAIGSGPADTIFPIQLRRPAAPVQLVGELQVGFNGTCHAKVVRGIISDPTQPGELLAARTTMAQEPTLFPIPDDVNELSVIAGGNAYTAQAPPEAGCPWQLRVRERNADD